MVHIVVKSCACTWWCLVVFCVGVSSASLCIMAVSLAFFTEHISFPASLLFVFCIGSTLETLSSLLCSHCALVPGCGDLLPLLYWLADYCLSSCRFVHSSPNCGDLSLLCSVLLNQCLLGCPSEYCVLLSDGLCGWMGLLC